MFSFNILKWLCSGEEKLESLEAAEEPLLQVAECGTCFYATVDNSHATQHGHGVICREGPHFENKTQHDWCGRWKPKLPG